jgi:hypothetical protein
MEIIMRVNFRHSGDGEPSRQRDSGLHRDSGRSPRRSRRGLTAWVMRHSVPLVLGVTISLAALGAAAINTPPMATRVPTVRMQASADSSSHYSGEHHCATEEGGGSYGWCWYHR